MNPIVLAQAVGLLESLAYVAVYLEPAPALAVQRIDDADKRWRKPHGLQHSTEER